jgi:hypothetical protein
MYKILITLFITAASLLLPACTTHPPQAVQNKFAEKNNRLHGYIANEGTYTQENLHKHPYADLLSSAEVNDITWQERKYMTDALDAFPKRWVLKDLSMVTGPRWLDDHHVAMSVRSYPGWVAKSNEPPRIISVNLDTGVITNSGYRGDLLCLNHKGDLMISLNPKPTGLTKFRDELNWYAGTWGQPLQEIKWQGGHFVPKYLCRFFPLGDLIHGPDWRSLPPGAHRMFPLLPEHGVLKESVKIKDDAALYLLDLIRNDGLAFRLNMPKPLDTDFKYQLWDNSYFYTQVANKPSITVYPSGESVFHDPPRLLKFWAHSHLSQVIGYGTKLGVLWTVASFSKKWRNQGIYLETNKGLIRIEEGEAGLGIVISPNGCRILSFVERGETYAKKRTGPMGHILIDLCNTGAK